MPRQNYLFKGPGKPRSRKGTGTSAPFLFGLSRGFYVPPKESFHRSANFNQVTRRRAPKESSPEPAKRPAGLKTAFIRLFGRSFDGA